MCVTASHLSIADDFDYTSAIPSLYPLSVDEVSICIIKTIFDNSCVNCISFCLLN